MHIEESAFDWHDEADFSLDYITAQMLPCLDEPDPDEPDDERLRESGQFGVGA